jgi:hypothetical protein
VGVLEAGILQAASPVRLRRKSGKASFFKMKMSMVANMGSERNRMNARGLL